MTLLALTAFQSATLALLTTAAIVALYFLKHRRRRMVVSSALLWKRVLANRLENSLFERLRRMLSVLLAIVIGLLIAMSIAQPEIEWLTGKTSKTVIVLDNSPSMQARMSDGRTRWQHAVDAARALVNRGAFRNEFRIVDTGGSFDSSYTTDHAELRRMIDGIHPVNSATRFPVMDTAMDAAVGTAGKQSAPNVYLITDGVSPLTVPAGVHTVSEFQAAANTGITAFEIRSTPSSLLAFEAYLEITNFGKTNRNVEIVVSGSGQQRITKNVQIDAGKTFKDSLDISKFEGGGVRAAIRSDGDSFSPDDVAYSYLPVKRRTRTLLVTTGNKFLESVLKLDSLVELSISTPAAYTGTGDYDAYVFDRYAPPQQPARPSLIIGTQGTQNAAWLKKSTGTVSKPAFETKMDSHAVMKHVALNDVSVETAGRIDATGLTVLAAADATTPLIVASERPQWVMTTFDLDSSDFPHHAGFPVFIDNTLSWFGRDRLALRRMPGVVDIPMANAQVRTVDGRSVDARPTTSHDGTAGEGTTFEAAEAGLYVASQGDASQYIAVNFANRQYSDINNSHIKEYSATGTSGTSAPLLRHELWYYMLCAALLLIGAEWFTYHRRITL